MVAEVGGFIDFSRTFLYLDLRIFDLDSGTTRIPWPESNGTCESRSEEGYDCHIFVHFPVKFDRDL